MDPALDAQPALAARVDRSRVPGVLSFVLGVLTVAGLTAGVVLAADRAFEAATWAAYVAVGVSVLAVALGIVAAIGGFGRGLGVAGAVLGVLANPLVLTPGLELIGGLWS